MIIMLMSERAEACTWKVRRRPCFSHSKWAESILHEMKPRLTPLLVGICRGIRNQGFVGGAKWIPYDFVQKDAEFRPNQNKIKPRLHPNSPCSDYLPRHPSFQLGEKLKSRSDDWRRSLQWASGLLLQPYTGTTRSWSASSPHPSTPCAKVAQSANQVL